MNVTRRHTLGALGLLIAGAAAINAAGAFDTSEAPREVLVEFEDDSDAFLGLGPAEGDTRSFVSVEEQSDGTVRIEIVDVNYDARTVIDNLVTFTNNGDRTIEELTMNGDGIEAENADVYIHDGLIEDLGPGDSAVGLGMTIDALRSNGHFGEPAIDGSITLRATTE